MSYCQPRSACQIRKPYSSIYVLSDARKIVTRFFKSELGNLSCDLVTGMRSCGITLWRDNNGHQKILQWSKTIVIEVRLNKSGQKKKKKTMGIRPVVLR